jgi:replicative DNA helicase
MNDLRIAPHSLEDERIVLACCLVAPEAVEYLPPPEDFYRHSHVEIARGVLHVALSGQEMTPANVYAACRKVENAKNLIADLSSDYRSVLEGQNAARRVREYASLRRLIAAASHAIEQAYAMEHPAPQIVATAQEQILSVTEKGATRTQTLAEVIDLEIAGLDQEPVKGIPSRCEVLNGFTDGYQNAELMIVGAHPGDGKTSLALSEAINAAWQGESVAFFSMEMSAKQIARRALSNIAGVDSRDLRNRNLRFEDRVTIEAKRRAYAEALSRFHIEDSMYQIEAMMTKARFLAKQGVRFFAFDYLMKFHTTKNFEERERVKYYCEKLSELAKTCNVSVMALSQFTKAAERRPQVDDLYGAKAIEAEAHKILLLFDPKRCDYVEPDVDLNRIDPIMNQPVDMLAGLHFGDLCKNREGDCGLIPFNYNRKTTLFEDWHGPKPRFKKKPVAR